MVNTNGGGAGRGEVLFAKCMEAKDVRACIFGFTILIKICEVHLRQSHLKTVQLYKKIVKSEQKPPPRSWLDYSNKNI